MLAERDAQRDEITCIKEVEFPRKAQAVADAWKGKCERLEAERDALRINLDDHRALVFVLRKEVEKLRVKVTEMEQQEPVAWRTFDGEGGYDYRSYEDNENYKLGWDTRNPNHIGWVEPLYVLPCAHHTQSVPPALLVAATDLVAQMKIVARVGFVDAPDDKDSCAAFCVAEGTWLELMGCVESLAAALTAAPKLEE